jgi:alkylation response protein AidB-like acyl-CoA dehydrogenase
MVSLAYHEDGMGSSPDALATTAAVEGEVVVVEGTKLFVPNAGVADDLVVVARDPAATGAGAVRLAVVPTSAAGVRQSRLTTFAHDAQHEVSFGAVRLPVDRVLADATLVPGRSWRRCVASPPPCNAWKWSAVPGRCWT